MDNTWVLDVESRIYTIVKSKSSVRLKEKFKELIYTSDNESNGDVTNKQTAYIHMLEPKSVGNDLEGTDINGILCTFEVQSIVSTSKTDCIEIMRELLIQFKNLGFDAVSIPVPTKRDTMFVMTARFRRVIGYGDSI